MTTLSGTEALLELNRMKEDLDTSWRIERTRIDDSLRYLATHVLNEDYEEIKSTINEEINTGERNKNQKPSQWGVNKFLPKNTAEHKNILIATTYLLLSEAEHDQGLLSSAYKLICNASYTEGYASGLVEPRINQGSRGRTKSSLDNKYKIASLLKSKRPIAGWKTEREAANYIYEDAVKLNKEENMKLTPSQLANLITTWTKEEGSACRTAFLGDNM